jgi:antibiotic biosynthesis monooxygenase (ABM) superfamily enzyme
MELLTMRMSILLGFSVMPLLQRFVLPWLRPVTDGLQKV